MTAAIVSFTYINVSQGSVATQFSCGEINNNDFIANFPQSVTVKEFLKLVNIWRRYGQKYGGMFFLTHGVHAIAYNAVARRNRLKRCLCKAVATSAKHEPRCGAIVQSLQCRYQPTTEN